MGHQRARVPGGRFRKGWLGPASKSARTQKNRAYLHPHLANRKSLMVTSVNQTARPRPTQDGSCHAKGAVPRTGQEFHSEKKTDGFCTENTTESQKSVQTGKPGQSTAHERLSI